jgi:hypothetical protein
MRIVFVFTTLLLTVSSTLFAQETAPKPQWIKGIKLSWTHNDYRIRESFDRNSISLGGFNSVQGYNLDVYVARYFAKKFQARAGVSHSMQGRSWNGETFRHYLLHADIGVRYEVLKPLFVEAGFRAGGIVATNDGYKSISKAQDLGWRVGIGAHLYKGLSIHADFYRSVTPYVSLSPQEIKFDVLRQNIGIGLSYEF